MPPTPRSDDQKAGGPNAAPVLVPLFLSSIAITLFLFRSPLHRILRFLRWKDDDVVYVPLGRLDHHERVPNSPYQRWRPLEPLWERATIDGTEFRPRPLYTEGGSSQPIEQSRYFYCTNPECSGDDIASELSPELDRYFDEGQAGVARYHSAHRGRHSIMDDDEERPTRGWDVTMGRGPGHTPGRIETVVSRRVESVVEWLVGWITRGEE